MRFLGLLGLGVLAAAGAFGLNLVPFLQQTGITQAVLRIIILALVLFGLWRGLAATTVPAATRRRRWFAVAIGLEIGDTLVGILAVLVAGIVNRNRAAGVGWNLLGILDLADAFVLGTLAVQGQFPYPLVLIPTFAVPLSILFHAVSLRQLRRGAHSASQTSSATTASTSAVPAQVG